MSLLRNTRARRIFLAVASIGTLAAAVYALAAPYHSAN
jgi:hypothetical protein